MTADPGWEPIESAPRDGTHVLGFRPWDGNYKSDMPKHWEIWWRTDKWGYSGFMDWEGRRLNVRYWRPLPPPPSQEG